VRKFDIYIPEIRPFEQSTDLATPLLILLWFFGEKCFGTKLLSDFSEKRKGISAISSILKLGVCTRFSPEKGASSRAIGCRYECSGSGSRSCSSLSITTTSSVGFSVGLSGGRVGERCL
jgi:hypothetical protein